MMTTCSSVAEALALHCAVCFAGQTYSTWIRRAREVIIRSGPLMPSDLFADPSLCEGTDYVIVMPERSGFENIAGPLGFEWETDLSVSSALSLQQGERQITITTDRTHPVPGIIAVFWEHDSKRRVSARYVVQPGQTVDAIASALAEQIPGVSASKGVLTVPVGRIFGRVAGYSHTVRLLRRRKQSFRISVWSSDRSLRDMLGDFLATSVFSGDWLALLDGRCAQVVPAGEAIEDATQMENLFRRDLFLSVIWDQCEALWSPQMIAGGGAITDSGGISVFGDDAGSEWGIIPTVALDELIAEHSRPELYRHWYCDRFGTVQRKI